MNTTDDPVVARTYPRIPGEGASFDDLLYEWMGRAPWLAISFLSHALVLLLLAVIPWHLFQDTPEQVIRLAPPEVVEELFHDDPDVEPPPEVLPLVEDVEPTLVENPTLEARDDSSEADADLANDARDPNHDPFEAMAFNDLLGVGGSAGGPGGGFGRGTGRGGDGNTHENVLLGLDWLANHQDDDGRWDADGFMKHDPAADLCEGPGHAEHDVGVTGLALLAMLGDGHTTRRGQYKENVSRAVKWLHDQQDYESGLFGDAIGTAYMYDHSIATLAMCEAYYFSGSPIIHDTAQKAVGLVTRARNPYGAWRYDLSPRGENDTSVTGWMVFALKSAEEAGLKIDSQAFPDAITWFDEMTDPRSGRVGYQERGTASARVPGLNSEYPTGGTEAMTAVALLCRFFLGQDPQKTGSMQQHADLLLKSLPEWSEDGLTNDVYYWYYGTYAMYQMGGKHWKAWNRAMKRAVVGSQRREGSALGSWDPNGPWGAVGGRVYSTAVMTLCLEVYYRYAKVLGAR